MASRISRHVFVECTANCYFIVSSLCTRKDTQVISIEPTSGQLVYTAIPGVDLFPKEQDALAAISQRFGGVLHVLPFAAILGYVVLGREAWLHIATKVDSCFPQFPSSFSLVHRPIAHQADTTLVLPPTHRVFTVTESRWLHIGLQSPLSPPPMGDFRSSTCLEPAQHAGPGAAERDVQLPTSHLTQASAISEDQTQQISSPANVCTQTAPPPPASPRDLALSLLAERRAAEAISWGAAQAAALPMPSAYQGPVTSTPSPDDSILFANQRTPPRPPPPPGAPDAPTGQSGRGESPLTSLAGYEETPEFRGLWWSLHRTGMAQNGRECGAGDLPPDVTPAWGSPDVRQDLAGGGAPPGGLPLIYYDAKTHERARAFSVDGTHWYCETADLTRPYPSGRQVDDYDPAFCWNTLFRVPFELAGLGQWCAVLLQGAAMGRELLMHTKRPGYLGFMARKSAVNPGARFYARGLNDAAGAGNEMECEQLLVVDVNGASIVIKEKPFELVPLYWQRVATRYQHRPIWCVSLLRCDEKQQSELRLTEAFQESLRIARRAKVDSPALSIVNFDWHHNLKDNRGTATHEHSNFNLKTTGAPPPTSTPISINQGDTPKTASPQSAKFSTLAYEHPRPSPHWSSTLPYQPPRQTLGLNYATQGLWTKLKDIVRDVGMSSGTVRLLPALASRCCCSHPSIYRPNPPCLLLPRTSASGAVGVGATQSGMLRWNCADSVDRTNLGTFFCSIQLLAEQCRVLCHGLPGLPNEPWAAFALNLDEIQKMLPSNVLAALAEIYVQTGDINSELYTSSPAIHTHLMRAFSPNLGAAPSNTLVPSQPLTTTATALTALSPSIITALTAPHSPHSPHSTTTTSPPSPWHHTAPLSNFPSRHTHTRPGDPSDLHPASHLRRSHHIFSPRRSPCLSVPHAHVHRFSIVVLLLICGHPTLSHPIPLPSMKRRIQNVYRDAQMQSCYEAYVGLVDFPRLYPFHYHLYSKALHRPAPTPSSLLLPAGTRAPHPYMLTGHLNDLPARSPPFALTALPVSTLLRPVNADLSVCPTGTPWGAALCLGTAGLAAWGPSLIAHSPSLGGGTRGTMSLESGSLAAMVAEASATPLLRPAHPSASHSAAASVSRPPPASPAPNPNPATTTPRTTPKLARLPPPTPPPPLLDPPFPTPIGGSQARRTGAGEPDEGPVPSGGYPRCPLPPTTSLGPAALEILRNVVGITQDGIDIAELYIWLARPSRITHILFHQLPPAPPPAASAAAASPASPQPGAPAGAPPEMSPPPQAEAAHLVAPSCCPCFADVAVGPTIDKLVPVLENALLARHLTGPEGHVPHAASTGAFFAGQQQQQPQHQQQQQQPSSGAGEQEDTWLPCVEWAALPGLPSTPTSGPTEPLSALGAPEGCGGPAVYTTVLSIPPGANGDAPDGGSDDALQDLLVGEEPVMPRKRGLEVTAGIARTHPLGEVLAEGRRAVGPARLVRITLRGANASQLVVGKAVVFGYPIDTPCPLVAPPPLHTTPSAPAPAPAAPAASTPPPSSTALIPAPPALAASAALPVLVALLRHTFRFYQRVHPFLRWPPEAPAGPMRGAAAGGGAALTIPGRGPEAEEAAAAAHAEHESFVPTKTVESSPLAEACTLGDPLGGGSSISIGAPPSSSPLAHDHEEPPPSPTAASAPAETSRAGSGAHFQAIAEADDPLAALAASEPDEEEDGDDDSSHQQQQQQPPQPPQPRSAPGLPRFARHPDLRPVALVRALGLELAATVVGLGWGPFGALLRRAVGVVGLRPEDADRAMAELEWEQFVLAPGDLPTQQPASQKVTCIPSRGWREPQPLCQPCGSQVAHQLALIQHVALLREETLLSQTEELAGPLRQLALCPQHISVSAPLLHTLTRPIPLPYQLALCPQHISVSARVHPTAHSATARPAPAATDLGLAMAALGSTRRCRDQSGHLPRGRFLHGCAHGHGTAAVPAVGNSRSATRGAPLGIARCDASRHPTLHSASSSSSSVSFAPRRPPPGLPWVEFSLVLPCPALVTAVSLIADHTGLPAAEGALQLSIQGSAFAPISGPQRGPWGVPNLGPFGEAESPLNPPLSCRLVAIRLTRSGLPQGASLPPFHLHRIRVLGRPVPFQIDRSPALSAPDEQAIRRVLATPLCGLQTAGPLRRPVRGWASPRPASSHLHPPHTGTQSPVRRPGPSNPGVELRFAGGRKFVAAIKLTLRTAIEALDLPVMLHLTAAGKDPASHHHQAYPLALPPAPFTGSVFVELPPEALPRSASLCVSLSCPCHDRWMGHSPLGPWILRVTAYA
ncbi:putative Synaptojanin; N-terminal [Paratrimastix pyriformis]|uniref:Synaptojanin n=1 Tax=Paratrimastix pyriformis TaxID=342808 RepID=A0ABQ8UAV4_9EUKA|nr:putative Synaptojanin; N-terminal [Paratrimastix pyriformis]